MLFYKCNLCGNFITKKKKKTAVTPVCCGKTMTEITANTTDAAQEKHVPVVNGDSDTVHVNIGSVDHPMLEEHYIQFIVLETSKGYQKKDLKPGDAPCASFKLTDGEKAIAVYEYCNLHGLWKTEF